MNQVDLISDIAERVGVDFDAVEWAVQAWLDAAADALVEHGTVDLGALGRLHRIMLPCDEDEPEEAVVVHRPRVDETIGKYRGIVFDENTKVGPLQRLET